MRSERLAARADRVAAVVHQRRRPVGHFLWPALMLAALFFLRDRDFGSSGLLLGALALPSILGMNAAMGMVSMSQQLTADREDGTLLRAKATPNGMLGYLVGKIVSVAGWSAGRPGRSSWFQGCSYRRAGARRRASGWLDPGLGAGARAGRDAADRRGPRLGLHQRPDPGSDHAADARPDRDLRASSTRSPRCPAGCSGSRQVFPIYWLGLGMRSALAARRARSWSRSVESWRHLETVGVLGAWAVAGLLVAPIVLRRMARRESGSAVADRRDRALRSSVR